MSTPGDLLFHIRATQLYLNAYVQTVDGWVYTATVIRRYWPMWPWPGCAPSCLSCKALTGWLRDHHAFLPARMLAYVETLEADIDVRSARISELVKPWRGQLMILDSITAVGPREAEVILAEIGPAMSRFPTAGHLASWAGRCPGQRESAARRGSAKRH